EVELRVDGDPVALSLIESNYAAMEDMREGLGSIRLTLRATLKGDAAGHVLQFRNGHLPQVSAYLVNCLAGPAIGADRLLVGQQERDEGQKSIRFAYSFGDDVRSAMIGSW